MKLSRLLLAAALILSLFSGCGRKAEAQGDTILATTYPMYYLTARLTEGMEDVTVELMISDSVSCLHDYTLTTEQMKKIDRADLIVMNGGGLEDFMASALAGVPEENIIAPGDTMETPVGWLDPREDPHYWLNPVWYGGAANIVFEALAQRYPEQYKLLDFNCRYLGEELSDLNQRVAGLWDGLSCREMVTFHDGFSWLAKGAQLDILASIEEEEGAEASAQEIKKICDLIVEHQIPAIFVEKNGSTNAAEIISRETGVKIYTLNTMMDGKTDYFTAMRENVQALKEALS